MKGDDNGESQTGQVSSRGASETAEWPSADTAPEPETGPGARGIPDDLALPEQLLPALLQPVTASAPSEDERERDPDIGGGFTPGDSEGESDDEDEPVIQSGGDESLFEQDDPLAQAYDLEEGTPLAKETELATEAAAVMPWRSKVRSAKEFFNSELLYRFDILEEEDRAALPGRYRIELKGYQGGVWTIDVGDSLQVVNRREDAEIVFAMQQRDFLNLVNGQLNPQLAIFAQKMRIAGDVRKAVHFQLLLVPHND